MRRILLALLVVGSLFPLRTAGADCPPSLAFEWGWPGNDPGEFNGPRDVAVGPGGEVYVADSGNTRVQIFHRDGRFISRHVLGTGPLAVDQDGNYWVSGFVWLTKYSPEGAGLLRINLSGNVGVAVGPDGRIYACTVGPTRLYAFSPDGTQEKYWSGFRGLADVAVGANGDIYTAEAGRVQRIRGSEVTEWEIPESAQGTSVTVDGQGNVTVGTADRIHTFSGSGALLCSWSVAAGAGLAVNEAGDVYVVDPGNDRVVMYGARLPGDDPPLPPPAPSPPHDAGIILHVAPPGDPCNAPRRLEEAVTLAPADPEGARYHVYLLGTPDTRRGVEDAGVGGLQLGIAYGPGVRVLDWHPCARLEFPGQGWPEPGSGNTLTWGTGASCPEIEIAVAGFFEVMAYGRAVMSVAPWPVTGVVKIANCEAAEERVLAMSRVGWISLGGASVGTDSDGCNPVLAPCQGPTPVLSTTWGRLKTLYR